MTTPSLGMICFAIIKCTKFDGSDMEELGPNFTAISGLEWLGQGHQQSLSSLEHIQLPIHYRSSYVFILYSFQDMASYWLNTADVSYLTYIWHLSRGWPFWIFTNSRGVRKLESLDYGAILIAW